MKPESDVLFDLIIKLRFESAFGKRFFVCYNNYIRMELEDRSPVLANNFEWLVHSTDMYPADSEVGIFVKPFNIQIMHKPESEDEKAVDINE